MDGFLSPQYFASKASRLEVPTFEQILAASNETPSGFENPVNVHGLTNQNLGTGFQQFLSGQTDGQYPTRGYPVSGQDDMYMFPGVMGFAPSRPPSTEFLRNGWHVPDTIIFG